jgi:recombination protein RecT
MEAPKTEAKPVQTPVRTLQLAIAQRSSSFAAIATKYLTAERLVKLSQSIVGRYPKLAECTAGSVLTCLMDCARLGLEPMVPGGMWLVPFREKKYYVCTGIVDYRGALDVCRRSKQIVAAAAELRCEADEWEYRIDASSESLTVLRHTPAEGDRGRILGAYAAVKLRTGGCHVAYLTLAEIDFYRAKSRGADSDFSPWKNFPDAMRKKTAVRRVVTLLPRTEHIQNLREVFAREDEEQTDLNSGVRAQIRAVTEGAEDAEVIEEVDPNTKEKVPSQEEIDAAREVGSDG